MDKDELIDRINELRTQTNISARELSLRIDKNESYINRLEYRKNFEPSISVITAICDACGISVEQFFYHDMDEYKTDKDILNLIKDASPEQKEAIRTLLKK